MAAQNYDKFKRNLEQLKRKYQGVWTLFVPRDFDSQPGEVEENFEQYYYLILRRPTLFEFNVYTKYVMEGDMVSAYETILNSCVLDGDEIIKSNDDYFLPVIFSSKFSTGLENSLGKTKTYIDTKTFEVWVSKNEIEEELTYNDCINNPDNFYHFKFKKIGRENLRDSSIFNSVQLQQSMLSSLCIEGDPSLILKEEIFYSLFYSKILNIIFNIKMDFIKKN